VYAKKPSGKWYTRRTVFSLFVLLFLVGVPFIRVNGNPLILLDIANRKFIIFGAIFWAQDTFILALLMLSFVLFVVLFTVTFGRLFCGWACPQTIFLEMVFRKIEYIIEGDYRERYNLDSSSWTGKKLLKKILKHGIFILISIAISSPDPDIVNLAQSNISVSSADNEYANDQSCPLTSTSRRPPP